ncbi:MAG: DUF3429 domain-containing protein [Gammaproteobacteria bacterium]
MKPLPLVAWLLGFGGVIPFLVLFLALLPGLSPGFASSQDITLWLLAYAAIILSFIGAVHWGVANHDGAPCLVRYVTAAQQRSIFYCITRHACLRCGCTPAV